MTETESKLWMLVVEHLGALLAAAVFYTAALSVAKEHVLQATSLIIAVGAALLLRRAIRVLIRWFDEAKAKGVSNFAAPFCAILLQVAFVIVMWSFAFLFFNQISQPDEAPFCSGSEPIQPAKFGLLDAIYFAVTSFATVGYGDIYACTAFSRWAVMAELSTTVTIGILTLSALVSVMIELGRAALAKATAPSVTSPPIFLAMGIIALAEPFIYGFLSVAFTDNPGLLRLYVGISAVLAIGMAVGALLSGCTQMLVPREKAGMRLVTSVQLVVLAYILFVEGFGYLYLLMDQPGAYSFARQGETALGFVSAMYFSITTLSTAGFGDIAPLAPAPRIIVITEILVGMVFALFAFSLTISAIVNQRLLPPATAQAPRRAETKVKLAVPSRRAGNTRRRD